MCTDLTSTAAIALFLALALFLAFACFSGSARAQELNETVEQDDENLFETNALECEIELTYSASAINMPKFDATFAIRNNRPTELSAWQVVWRYENEKLIPGSVEGAILLATGTSNGGPARVVNTRNNAPITPFSTKGFTFTAYSTLVETEARNTSRAPSSVSVNGLQCAPIYPSKGLGGVRDDFSDEVLRVEECVPPMEANDSEVLFLPSCEQAYCCGLITPSGTTEAQQEVEDLQNDEARKSLLPEGQVIAEGNEIAWTDCSMNATVVVVQNSTGGDESPLTAAMIEPGGYFGLCTNTSVGPLFGEDFFDFYMLANEDQAVSLSVAVGISTQGPRTTLQQLIEVEEPLYAVTDLNEGDMWKHVTMDLNELGVPGWGFFGIKNTEGGQAIPIFLYDMGLYASVDEAVGKAQPPESLSWEYLKSNANLTGIAELVEESDQGAADGDNAFLPAILFAASAVVVIMVVAVAISLTVRSRQQKKGNVERSDSNLSALSARSLFERLDLRGLKDAIVKRYDRKSGQGVGPSVLMEEGAPQDGVFNINFDKEIQLQEILGSGGFGTVHKATWRGDDVAVKIMHGMTEGSKMLDTFKKEIFLLSRLHHPGIINFLGASLEPPNVCIVQELAQRGSLYTLLHGDDSENRPMKYVELLQYGLDIADAMAYLHPTVVHRDLKSQNVLLDSNMRAKVCDFGIAKFKDKTLLTTVNSQAGTPAYMAPELFAAGEISEKVDVFSYGVLLWECFTGCVPWGELSTPMQVIFAVGVQKQRLPIPPHCPTFLSNLMQDCWKQEAEERPSFSQILTWMEIEYDKYVAAKSLMVAEGIESARDSSSRG